MPFFASFLRVFASTRGDRRGEPRSDVELPCALISPDEVFHGIIEQISARGLLIRVPDLKGGLPSPDAIRLVQETSPFAVNGRIVWRRMARRDLLVGVHLTESPAWVLKR